MSNNIGKLCRSLAQLADVRFDVGHLPASTTPSTSTMIISTR